MGGKAKSRQQGGGASKTAASASAGPAVKAGQQAKAGTAAVEGPYTDYKLQLLLLVGLVAPWVYAATALGKDAAEVGNQLASSLHLKAAIEDHRFLHTQEFWLLIAALSTPHVTYLIVWTNAKAFDRLTRPIAEPFQVFAYLAHAIKALQMAAALYYFVGPERLTSTEALGALAAELKAYLLECDPLKLLLCGQLLAYGQLFNYYVYKTIGEAGVYYGCRLGQEVPWVYGFPFSTVPHPQYLGATLSFVGLALLFATPLTIAQGIYGVAAAFVIFYAFSSWVEACL